MRRGRKSGVMPNFLTASERERKVIEPIERIKKKRGPRERYHVSAIRVEQQEFFMVQKSGCAFEVSSKVSL